MEIGAVRVGQETSVWTVKQSLELSKQQMTETLKGLAIVGSTEPGKGTLLDVRV